LGDSPYKKKVKKKDVSDPLSPRRADVEVDKEEEEKE